MPTCPATCSVADGGVYPRSGDLCDAAPMDLERALEFVRPRNKAVLTTIRTDGRPQLSNVLYAIGDDGTLMFSVTRQAGEDGQHAP